MTGKQILEREEHNLDLIMLYYEGIFWKAYEHSAFILCSQQGKLKPTRKTLKSLDGASIISVGFPQASESKFISNLETVSRTDKELILKANKMISLSDFEIWKDSCPQSDTKEKEVKSSSHITSVESSVCSRISAFNLVSATPLECMAFLSEIQKLLVNKM